ncbi:hypothetical protein GPL21_02295 [Bradyrhizobium pachyrhizi]|uniref:UvrD-like helicase ATP-binding domain-containing protein n=1 Tax=Bradyrhizobium pachyrhizi TaxID=280333 RepID=A0A844SE40_9BRAD|nr:UvrD-helicase domain-containing protein [Bradyrhizobium pachyrhizi]MVT63947.1 hypothetical protein [Bradyrhizobium pachyrhizi]
MTKIVDDAERLRALTELHSCLLVEAAAGTGKTSLLAGRVVMLLAAGVDPRSIIALYLQRIVEGRIPDELRAALPTGPSDAQNAMLRHAADRLDELTCGTIHSFCHDILRAYSVEAAIDPGAEVLDGDQADFLFDGIFDRWWRNRLDRSAPAPRDPIASVARRDPPSPTAFFPATEFRNELSFPTTMAGLALADGIYWRVYALVPTDNGDLLIKIPMYAPQIQDVIKSCPVSH